LNNTTDNNSFDQDPKIFSVSEINRMVRDVLLNNFTTIWIKGEISGFRQFTSGHWYFDLKDAQSQVSCTMWSGKNKQINWQPKNGDLIEAQCQVGLWEAQGKYQLNVEFFQKAGLGDLFEKFNQLKNKLDSEGLFLSSHKKTLPSYPLKIGVITSPDAAALQDVLVTIKRRAIYASITIYPTLVQGENASRQIIKSIQLANKRNEVDVLILCRGGGSMDDLWAFNDESLAREIYGSSLPIISGIGHETDFTIADFVSDHRAATPTAAAEILTENILNLPNNLNYYQSQLLNMIDAKIQGMKQKFDYLEKRLLSPNQVIKIQYEKLKTYKRQLQQLIETPLAKYVNQLKSIQSHLSIKKYHQGLDEKKRLLETSDKKLKKIIINNLKKNRELITNYHQRLNLLNPDLILERGYSIVYDKNKNILSNSANINVNEKINLKFHRGYAEAKITKNSNKK